MEQLLGNMGTLASTELRRDALTIASAGYNAINVGKALRHDVRVENDELVLGETRRPLNNRRVFFVGIGKCAIAGGEAIEDILGDRLTGGIALDVSPIDEHNLKKITPYIGTHPLPSDINERATEHIMELLADCTENDLVIALISGGGSTLLCSHKKPMTCLDESELFTELTSRGATIQEINTVRKHTSLARGGGLAKIAYPAEVAALIVSDVPGNDIRYIASGPTVQDDSTIEDAEAVLTHYGIPVVDPIKLIPTPKEDNYFEHVTNTLFLTNKDALAAMKETAEKLGYTATVVNDQISGEASAFAHEALETLHSAPAKSVFLYAGETTVSLGSTHGKGGRNQEMALAALKEIRDDELLLPFASDGHDNSDHGGALADATTQEHVAEHHLDIEHALAEHESYNFFTTSGDALVTGYTGSNVSDLLIAIKS